jgi:hypothetical protein
LSDAIAYVLDNPLEANIVGQRGRDRMAEFELQQVIRLHEQLYEDALST